MSAPASSARGPVVVNDVFRGQLHKKSEWSNSWSLRDVCLSRTKLIYTHVWRADPGVLLVADINQVHKILHDPCRFSIETSSRLLMHFRASKAEHCDQWVSRIQAAVVALQRGQQAASADGSTAPAEDLVPHDHLRVPIMIREGPEVVGRYKLDLPVRSSIYNLRELIADRLGLQPRNLVLEGFDGGIITHDKDLLAIIDAPASMMQRIVVTLPLNASPKSSISSSHASFEHDVAPENAEQGAQQVDSDISPSSAVPDDDLIVGQFDEDTDDAPPPAYDSLFSGVSQSSVASESSVDESNAGDTLSPLLQTTRAPSVPRSRTNSGDDRSSPTLGGGGIGVGDGRDFPRRDSFLEDTSGPQHVFSVTGGYSEGVIGSYSSPSMLAANMSVFRAHPSQADQQGQGPHSSRGLGPGPSDKRSPDDSGGTKDGVDLGPCEDDAPPQYTDIVTTPSTAGDLEKPAPTRPTSLGMQNLNSSEAARSSETGKASEDRHTEDLKYHEVKSPQGFCVTAIESFQNQRFIWLRGWVPLSTSYAQPDHSDFLGLQRVPRNANTFRSLTSRIDEIGEAALGASGDDIEYRWLDTWRLDIHCREAEWLQPAQTQPTSAPSFYSFQEYRDIIDPATGWVYAKRYEDFLQVCRYCSGTVGSPVLCPKLYGQFTATRCLSSHRNVGDSHERLTVNDVDGGCEWCTSSASRAQKAAMRQPRRHRRAKGLAGLTHKNRYTVPRKAFLNILHVRSVGCCLRTL